MPALSVAKRLVLLALFASIPAATWATHAQSLHKVDSPDMRSAIQLHVEEGVDVGGGKPGFKLALSGWPPETAFEVYGLDAKGVRVSLVDDAMVDAGGAALVAVPYEATGLHPGEWIIGVASKDLSRGERLLIPRVLRDKRGWRLDFKSLGEPQPSP